MSSTRPAPTRAWPLLLWSLQLAGPLGLAGAVLSVPDPVPARWLGALLLLCLWVLGALGVLASPRGRAWLDRSAAQLALCALTTLVMLAGAEGLLRALTRVDVDGNVFLGDQRLRPYQLPVSTIESRAAAYYASTETVLVEDPQLGWKPRPLGRNSLYAYDARSVRIDPEAPSAEPARAQPSLRILLFGDSFTHGDEVPYRDSWAYLLDEDLRAVGIEVQISNLGVGGYGMDQALLRWRAVADEISADLVIFGLMLADVPRNTFMIPPLAMRTGLPFSKPRFVLEGAELRLINSPAPPTRELADIVRNITRWPLVPYESAYDPADYAVRPWQRSRLARLAVHRIRDRLESDPLLRSDRRALARRIIDEFRDDVQRRGADFMVVSVPRRKYLRDRLKTGVLPGAEFLRELSADFLFVPTEEALYAARDDDSFRSLFMPHGHFSHAGNAIVAAQVAQAVRDWIAQRRTLRSDAGQRR
jgi:hypothetical protein